MRKKKRKRDRKQYAIHDPGLDSEPGKENATKNIIGTTGKNLSKICGLPEL